MQREGSFHHGLANDDVFPPDWLDLSSVFPPDVLVKEASDALCRYEIFVRALFNAIVFVSPSGLEFNT